MRTILAIIFLIFTIIAYIGLIVPLIALFTIPLTPGETYGPLGIANPPLVMLLVWGTVCLILSIITIKLFKGKYVICISKPKMNLSHL